ncbi:MAG: hypothetical protein HZA35_04205 [Parcubacteria group bacterium]|nr:hypothetical protein [Parcubacteria group bacterium]
MKYLIPFIIFIMSGTAYALSLNEAYFEPKPNETYSFIRTQNDVLTHGTTGTCYWYDGKDFFACTNDKKTPSLAELVTPQEPYTISNTSDTVYLTTDLKVVVNGKEIQ